MKAAAALIALALIGCRDRAPPPPKKLGPVVIAPVADPRPRPAQVAHLTLKVLGMT